MGLHGTVGDGRSERERSTVEMIRDRRPPLA
jgi:hypothetical protein